MSRDGADRWLHAIVILDADPSARVECPACGMESLRFESRPVRTDAARPTSGPARVLRCGFCGREAPAGLAGG